MIRTLLARFGLPAVLALTAGGVALGWYKSSIRAAEERGRTAVALAQRDSVRLAFNAAAMLRAAADQRDSLARVADAVRIARLERERRQDRGLAARLTQTVDSLRSLPVGSPIDSGQALAVRDSTIDVLRVDVGRADSVVASQASLLDLSVRQLARRDSTIRDLSGLLETTERLLAVQTKRASPGVFTRVRQSLPYLGVGLLAGFLLSR